MPNEPLVVEACHEFRVDGQGVTLIIEGAPEIPPLLIVPQLKAGFYMCAITTPLNGYLVSFNVNDQGEIVNVIRVRTWSQDTVIETSLAATVKELP